MSRRLDFAAMPAGDRGPAARHLASRLLGALAAVEAGPRPVDAAARAARDRAIGRHRAELGRLHRTAMRFGLALSPDVARHAASLPVRKARNMTKTAPADFPMWSEDLTAQPHHAAIRDVLRRMIVDQGIPPAEVVEAALANAAALSLEVKGLVETSLSFYRAGAALAHACPEIQGIAAESLRLTNAMADRLADKGGQRPAGMPRADH